MGDWQSLEAFAFGDGEGGVPGDKALADSLLALVLEGRKTATCWPAAWGPITHVGKRMVVLDSARRPRAVVETVELIQRRFDQVDWDFARAEGENYDLAGWRRDHEAWLTEVGVFSPDIPLWCERFKLTEILPAQDDQGPRDDRSLRPPARRHDPRHRLSGRHLREPGCRPLRPDPRPDGNP